MIKEAIIALAKKQDLTYEQAEKVMLGDRRKNLDEVNFALSRTKKQEVKK